MTGSLVLKFIWGYISARFSFTLLTRSFGSISSKKFGWHSAGVVLSVRKNRHSHLGGLGCCFLQAVPIQRWSCTNSCAIANMTMRSNEGFKEYAQKWGDLAGRVHPPLTDRELIEIFMGTFTRPFFNHLIGSSSVGFTELILIGERVEARIKSGKIQRVHLQMQGNNLSVERKSPMMCTAKRVITRAATTNMWGQSWSPVLYCNDNNREISEGKTSPKDSLQTSTFRCRKHCNTCWRWI